MLVGGYPQEHRIPKEEFRKVMKALEITGEEEALLMGVDHEKIPRLYLYSEFWHQFYTVAKYGDEELGIPSDKLFGREEAELALTHAKQCYSLADSLRYYLERRGSLGQ